VPDRASTQLFFVSVDPGHAWPVTKRKDDAPFPIQLMRGLGASTRHNALAYGYSLALTGAYGMLSAVGGQPDAADILCFGLGGSVAFTIAIATTTRGYRQRAHEQPREVRVLGSSIGFFSVLGALALVWLLATLLSGWVAWLVSAFAASVAYLALSAFELALARVLWPLLPAETIADPED
jgi:hypothetical protein